MGINEIIMYIMMFFMLIAAVDRILSQFGGSARFLGKFGKLIGGVTAIGVAMMLVPKDDAAQVKTEAEAQS